MKKAYSLMFLLMSAAYLFGQDTTLTKASPSGPDTVKKVIEPSVFLGSGYLMDKSGSGGYSYACLGLLTKQGNYRYGIFTNTTTVYVKFNGYDFRANEFTLGPELDGWGRLDSTFSFSFWAQPGFKFFSDYGHDQTFVNKAWQIDRGFYGVLGANINDDLNRWWRSWKINIMYQKPFWSKRTGTWEGGGNIGDKIDFKAVNKTYFKIQVESTGRKFKLKKGRLEPKLVLGYLYDGGSRKDLFEYGSGLALSFMKGARYFEIGSLQYRIRYGTDFGRPLHVFEVGCDFVSLYQLLKVNPKS